jgi:hypothetical protein
MSEEKNWNDNYDAQFEDLKGKILTKIETCDDGERMTFHCTDGQVFQLKYYQDCCAHCNVEDVCGEIEDLLGSPILMAEEAQSEEPTEAILAERRAEYEKEKAGDHCYYDSFEDYCSSRFDSETWTFYKLATVKGHVTLRWYGSSNGYYSETAIFERLGT